MLRFIVEILGIADDYAVICRFNGGEKRRVLLKPLLEQWDKTPEIQQLWTISYFQNVSLDSYGTLTWANGVDFCPDVLYKHSVPV
jgi:hypothetical protein